MKLALIGGPAIRKSTVADRLWELLTVAANVSITYEIIPLETPHEVRAFFKQFRRDDEFKGINIGIPWKTVLVKSVDQLVGGADLPAVNTIYKDHGLIVGEDTDPLAAQKAIEYEHNLYRCSTALVLSKRGLGKPIAQHLEKHLNMKTLLYNPTRHQPNSFHETGEITDLPSILRQRYDLIINAIPAGEHYGEYGLVQTRSPLTLDTLRQISTPETIILETNYIPMHSPLLRLASKLRLSLVTGDLMLVFRGAECLKRFTGVVLNEGTLSMIVGELGTFIAEREAELFMS